MESAEYVFTQALTGGTSIILMTEMYEGVCQGHMMSERLT